MTQAKSKKSLNPSVLAVLVLVVIALVSGGLLAILNDLLFVSEEERTNRSLNKVYASESFTELEIDADYASNADYGEIVYLYEAADGTIIISARGQKGWKGQSEIVMAVNNGTIVNMIVSTYGGDDKTTSIDADYLKQYTGMQVTADLKFTVSGEAGAVDVSSGASATHTMGSICSAANMAVYYLVNNDLLFVSEEERINHSLNKVYASESFTELEIDADYASNADYGEIVYLYEAADGTIIISARGQKGWKGQSEIVMAVNNGTIVNMIVSTYGGDDKTTSIDADYLKQYTGMQVTADLKFTVSGEAGAVDVSSGASATHTMGSICSAANMAVYYLVNSDVMGGDAQ